MLARSQVASREQVSRKLDSDRAILNLKNGAYYGSRD